jgi:hypothetical protein
MYIVSVYYYCCHLHGTEMKDADGSEKFLPASGSISAWPYLLM